MFTVEQVDQNLRLLQELLTCNETIYSWTFDPSGHLVTSNCKDLILNTIFENVGCKSYMLDYAAKHTSPLVLGAPLGLMWGIAFEYHEQALFRIHVIGPVFNTETSPKAIEESLNHNPMGLGFKLQLLEILPRLPVVSSILLYQDLLMLHYCVTGQKLSRSDIALQESRETDIDQPYKYHPKERYKVYEYERALLRMVREGDLDYHGVLGKAGQISNGVRATNGKPLEQSMITSATFVSLITRAAIEGGLSPESAYTLGDGYIQSIMRAKSVVEMGSIANTAYGDFVQRVHKARQNPALSAEIQQCCDYIEMNLESALSLRMLSEKIGYTEYYLSRKFKLEVGANVSEYIRFARIERAKTLLCSTELPIAEIAARLRFCSSSHFSKIFQSVTGQTPAQWRKNTAH